MSKEDELLKTSVAKLIEKGAVTITLLTGQTAEQKNPEAVKITGNINAPRLFVDSLHRFEILLAQQKFIESAKPKYIYL